MITLPSRRARARTCLATSLSSLEIRGPRQRLWRSASELRATSARRIYQTMGDPDVMLVNITNVALGVLTLGCWLAVLVYAGIELRRRFRDRLV